MNCEMHCIEVYENNFKSFYIIILYFNVEEDMVSTAIRTIIWSGGHGFLNIARIHGTWTYHEFCVFSRLYPLIFIQIPL